MRLIKLWPEPISGRDWGISEIGYIGHRSSRVQPGKASQFALKTRLRPPIWLGCSAESAPNERSGESMARDTLRAKVYAAESQVREAMESAVTAGAIDFFGSLLPPPVERRFGNLDEVEIYLRDCCVADEFRNLFGDMSVPQLRDRAGDDQAHYEFDTEMIALPSESEWAMRELVVLHELAHHVVGLRRPEAAHHGDYFAAVYCALVHNNLGGAAGLMLRAAFDGQGIAVGELS